MIISEAQNDTFWSMWSKVCRLNQWSKVDSEKQRKEFLKRCGFASLKDVDRVDGFTKVKNELTILLTPSIKAAQEAEDPLINKARTLRHVIRTEIVPCLALYRDADAFVKSVMEDKARWWKLDRPNIEITLEDLDGRPIMREVRGQIQESPSQLNQLLMTLSQRLNDLRKAAGHTIHEMKKAAKIHCACAQCEPRRPQRFVLPAEPVHEAEIANEEDPF